MTIVKKKWKLIALCLIIASLAIGTTYAWQLSVGYVVGGSFGAEAIKISVSKLKYRHGESGWSVLSDGQPVTVPALDIAEARLASERLEAAGGADKSDEELLAWYLDHEPDRTPASDREVSLGSQFMFSIENLGDAAAVFIDLTDVASFELATNGFMLPTEITWFADAVSESAAELGSGTVDQERASLALSELDAKLALASSLLDPLLTSYSALSADYEQKLQLAKDDEGNEELANAVYEAKAMLDAFDMEALIEAREACDNALGRCQRMRAVQEALEKASLALAPAWHAAIVDGYLRAESESGETRPLLLKELEAIAPTASGNLKIQTFLRYGDIVTQLGVTAIKSVYTRSDGQAYLLELDKGASVDIVFGVKMAFGSSSGTNGARFWLGASSAPVMATNSSPIAIKDMIGVDISNSADYEPMPRSKTIVINGEPISIFPLNDALGYKP
ncbi:MAG: hypothetical protein LBC41_13830 [Clostridiales bacterium]|jgi:hypothetical protein|nr:hypothetical protein [Clostridiales bacterium]